MGKGIWQRQSWVIAVSVMVFSVVTFYGAFARTTNAKGLRKVEHVPGELITKLRGEQMNAFSQTRMFHALERTLGPSSVLAINQFKTDPSLFKIRISKDEDLGRAIRALNQDASVEYSEPNFIYHALDVPPNDPDFEKLWGMHNIGQKDADGQVGSAGSDINVMPVWKEGYTGSRRILVAVIDTGVDWTHPDLKDNVYTNPGEIPDNGKDDDDNGFVDDIHGWNFVAKSNNSKDDHGHGSHCSGTIGGTGNNGIGVAGVNWEVSILPLKFLDADGSGSLEAAVEAINYARMMHVNIMSNSWGGGSFSQSLKDAIQAANDAGILFVAAAGNDHNDNDSSASYPATYDVPNVVSVAATDNRDQLASFSNYGATKVHVAAPGVKVYSTFKDGKFETYSGTSMATPHISGIAALLLSIHPEWTPAEIKARLIRTSDPVKALKKKVLARGRVNAYNALNDIVPPSPDPDESLWTTVTLDKVVESVHPYKINTNETFTIQYPGAKYLRVVFERLETEKGYDFVTVKDPSGMVSEQMSGNLGDNYVAEYVTGDTAMVAFKSDNTVVGWGFKISKIQVIK